MRVCVCACVFCVCVCGQVCHVMSYVCVCVICEHGTEAGGPSCVQVLAPDVMICAYSTL